MGPCASDTRSAKRKKDAADTKQKKPNASPVSRDTISCSVHPSRRCGIPLRQPFLLFLPKQHRLHNQPRCTLLQLRPHTCEESSGLGEGPPRVLPQLTISSGGRTHTEEGRGAINVLTLHASTRNHEKVCRLGRRQTAAAVRKARDPTPFLPRSAARLREPVQTHRDAGSLGVVPNEKKNAKMGEQGHERLGHGHSPRERKCRHTE